MIEVWLKHCLCERFVSSVGDHLDSVFNPLNPSEFPVDGTSEEKTSWWRQRLREKWTGEFQMRNIHGYRITKYDDNGKVVRVR